MSEPDFTVDIYQNEYLPDGGRDVNAIIRRSGSPSESQTA